MPRKFCLSVHSSDDITEITDYFTEIQLFKYIINNLADNKD